MLKPEIHNYRAWLTETDPENLKHLLRALLETARYNVLGFQDHLFDGGGYTAVWLLGESHLALHTFPEAGRSYLELSGCNGEKNRIFIEALCRKINTRKIEGEE